MAARWLGLLILIAALTGTNAHAQTGDVQQELVARGYVEYAQEVDGAADLYVGLIRMEPGARYGGWHTHPGPVWLVVRSGELTVFRSDSCRTVYAPGMAYLAAANAAFDLWNEGPIPVEIVFSGVIPAGEPATVPVDAPTDGCEM
jgi:quercetin dioxygenase-like cupin family protein